MLKAILPIFFQKYYVFKNYSMILSLLCHFLKMFNNSWWLLPTSRKPYPEGEAGQTDDPGVTAHMWPGRAVTRGNLHLRPSLLIHKPRLLGPLEARALKWHFFGADSSSLLKEIRWWCDLRGCRKYLCFICSLGSRLTSEKERKAWLISCF